MPLPYLAACSYSLRKNIEKSLKSAPLPRPLHADFRLIPMAPFACRMLLIGSVIERESANELECRGPPASRGAIPRPWQHARCAQRSVGLQERATTSLQRGARGRPLPFVAERGTEPL